MYLNQIELFSLVLQGFHRTGNNHGQLWCCKPLYQGPTEWSTLRPPSQRRISLGADQHPSKCFWEPHTSCWKTSSSNRYGAAMGSPHSPIVANLYMESFKISTLSSAKLTPTMCCRQWTTRSSYGYRTQTKSSSTPNRNKQHPQIQFTKEGGGEWRSINLLDILVKKENRRFKTTVYRKPTHTGRYTHFASHHHPQVNLEQSDVW